MKMLDERKSEKKEKNERSGKMGGYRKVKNSGGRRQALGLITAQTKHRQTGNTSSGFSVTS